MPLHRQCLICGAPFTTCPSLDKRYCGRECFYVSKRRPAEKLKTIYRTKHLMEDHPLARKGSTINEHRLILWDKIGPGQHACHHCGRMLTWGLAADSEHGEALWIDHLDRNPKNNDPENLAPSCQPCNALNCDRAVRDDENFRVIAKGSRVRGERRSCEYCSASFVAWPDKKNPRKGRFCSRSCARRKPRTKQALKGQAEATLWTDPRRTH